MCLRFINVRSSMVACALVTSNLLSACGSDLRASIADLGHAPIVNGTAQPQSVRLSSGQALAVGAVMEATRGGGWESFCTATLVAPDVAITAAHCVVDDWSGRDISPSEIRFAVGPDAAAPTAMFTLAALASHPDYDPWGDDAHHDVAVLLLDEPATRQLPKLAPLTVNCDALDAKSFVGSTVDNGGYGQTSTEGWPANSKKWWAEEEVTAQSSFDFTVDGYGRSGTCYGDSGGPSLSLQPGNSVRVVGTLSWGAEACGTIDHFARTDDNCSFYEQFFDVYGPAAAPTSAPPPPPPSTPAPTSQDATGDCDIEGVHFSASEAQEAFAFFASMTCEVCDDLFDSRICEDAINDADACMVGSTCTGCSDDDNRDDGVSCAEIAGYTGFGTQAATTLLDYVRQGTANEAAQVVEGVQLTAQQASAILTVVNEASAQELDLDVGLDSRAAANIVAARPIVSLDALAAVPYVGKAAILALLVYVSQ